MSRLASKTASPGVFQRVVPATSDLDVVNLDINGEFNIDTSTVSHGETTNLSVRTVRTTDGTWSLSLIPNVYFPSLSALVPLPPRPGICRIDIGGKTEMQVKGWVEGGVLLFPVRMRVTEDGIWTADTCKNRVFVPPYVGPSLYGSQGDPIFQPVENPSPRFIYAEAVRSHEGLLSPDEIRARKALRRRQKQARKVPVESLSREHRRALKLAGLARKTFYQTRHSGLRLAVSYDLRRFGYYVDIWNDIAKEVNASPILSPFTNDKLIALLDDRDGFAGEHAILTHGEWSRWRRYKWILSTKVREAEAARGWDVSSVSRCSRNWLWGPLPSS